MQLDWHDLRTNGCPALLRALKTIETDLTEQEVRLSQPNDTQAAITTVGVPGDTWLPSPDWVTEFAAVTDAK